jgi:hypothetical protein
LAFVSHLSAGVIGPLKAGLALEALETESIPNHLHASHPIDAAWELNYLFTTTWTVKLEIGTSIQYS